MIEKFASGIHFPRGGRRKFDGNYYLLKTVCKTKKGAREEKAEWKEKDHFVRIWKGSGKFPYHVFVRQ